MGKSADSAPCAGFHVPGIAYSESENERIIEIRERHAACSNREMVKSRDLRVRSFDFTVAVVRLCRSELTGDAIARRLAFQLVDAAGSVGANLEESADGQTKSDFIAKQFIALKEARESRFWLRVIVAAYPALAVKLKPFIQESNELVAMLTASIRTAKSNPRRGEPPPLEE